jgi:cephalosporin-C deacetylase-like acetyl esterase
MEQFYHLYIEQNNVDKIDLVTDAEEIKKLDKFWEEILERSKVEPPKQVLEKLEKKIEQLL